VGFEILRYAQNDKGGLRMTSWVLSSWTKWRICSVTIGILR